MELFDFLSGSAHVIDGNGFHGYLQDYLDRCDQRFLTLFTKMVEVNPNVRVIANYRFTIMHQLISNKKIGYRDITKISEDSCVIPFLLYWKKGNQSQAMLINTESYIEARGMYYCLSEPSNLFEPYKYQLLAVYADGNNDEEIVKVFSLLQKDDSNNAMIQRRLDDRWIHDIEQMREDCMLIAEQMFAQLKQNIANKLPTERASKIYHVVLRAFLLKKALYVRYMANKELLQERHDGNVMNQRLFAKSYIEDIRIVPLYTLFNE